MQTVSVRVKASAKLDRIERLQDGTFSISVKERPVEGRANEAVIRLLAEFLGVPSRNVSIIRGARSRTKVVRVAASGTERSRLGMTPDDI